MNLALVDTTGAERQSLTKWRNALQTQITRDVAPAWSLKPAQVRVVDTLADVGRNTLPIVILESADVAGELGFHDETPDGRDYARVFRHPTLDDGVALSSVIGHEAVEAIVDAHCNAWCNDAAGLLYALEACDPCEAATYMVGGVELSDFVLPAWFDANTPADAPTSYRHTCSGPFDVAPGGYAITYNGRKVTTINADRKPATLDVTKHHPASRTARRLAFPH